MRLAVYRGPNIQVLLRQAIKDFMPIAGEKVQQRAKGKLGTYQPGWPPLAERTRRRKAKHRGGQVMGPIAEIGDTPLIDTGAMLRSISHREVGTETHITAAHPMEQHEQDFTVGDFIPDNPYLPARPVMVPALEESIPSIIEELEAFVALRL